MNAVNIYELSSSPAPEEWKKLPEVIKQRPRKIIMELSLSRLDGTNICLWYYRTLKDVFWHPHGDPIVVFDKEDSNDKNV